MYQDSKLVDFSYLGDIEEQEHQFSKLCTITPTLESICETTDSNDKEFDMSATYVVNHACIHNKPSNIGRECKILVKNDKLALIAFPETREMSHDMFYRLEDLTLKQSL